MKRLHIIIVVISLLTAAAVVVGAVLIAHSRRPHFAIVKQHTVSQSELKAADGQHGHLCYVAIDGTVYQIIDSAFWQNGKHLPSDGLAYCGADLSNVIDQAPHGRSVLKILPIVGPLQKN